MNDQIEKLLLQKNHHIYLYEEITQEAFRSFSLRSRYLRLHKKAKEINIYLSTIGGDVDYALGIVDEINGLKDAGIKVNTIGVGQVYSCGIFILCAADYRYGTENTTYMLHPFQYAFDEESHVQVAEYVKYTDKLYSEVMVWLATRCGQTKIKKFIERVKDSVYLNNDMAKELGLIHEDWNYKYEHGLQPTNGGSSKK